MSSFYLYFAYNFQSIVNVTDDQHFSVIFLSGGNGASTTAEILHTNGSRICSLPDLPSARRRHSQTGLTLCGGVDSPATTTCHTLSSTGSWVQSHSIAQRRWDHSAWASPQGVMLLGGADTSARTTTEVLLESGDTSPSFSLDYSAR